ncbi:MAG: hypothetical protein P4L41_01290 [Flavipsychrobacter sp.]|nr:hypothetical protein [Flavipsychrobacter sp.]
MKNLLITALFTGITFSMCAQEDTLKKGYELRGKEKYGYIVSKDDKKTEGIVKLMGTKTTPWVNQQKVKFVAKEDLNASKKKQKFDKLDVDDLKEYVAYESDSKERHFRLINYTNKNESAKSTTVTDLAGKSKTLKKSSISDHMAEVITDGKITMYRLYDYPTPIDAGSKDVHLLQNEEQNIIDNPTLLYQKGDNKVKELHIADIKGLVKDCKTVSDKLAAGKYSSYNPAKEEKPQSELDKMIKHKLDVVGNQIIAVGTEVFSDYNTNCQ